MEQNQTTTDASTAERRIKIHVKQSHLRRIFALGEISPSLSLQNIFDAALTIGLNRLEGGEA